MPGLFDPSTILLVFLFYFGYTLTQSTLFSPYSHCALGYDQVSHKTLIGWLTTIGLCGKTVWGRGLKTDLP